MKITMQRPSGMRRIDNGFGGVDERAMIEEFHARHGAGAAEELGRLLSSSYPAPRFSVFVKPKSAREVFEARAREAGHSPTVIADFKLISS